MSARHRGLPRVAFERLQAAAAARGLKLIVTADGRVALVQRGRIVLQRKTIHTLERAFAAGAEVTA